MTAIKAGWLYSGPLRSEQSQGWYVPVMDKDGTLKGGATDLEKAANVLEKAADYARGGLS